MTDLTKSEIRDVAAGADPARNVLNDILDGTHDFSGLTLNNTSSSTSGSESVEPMVHAVTMTGAGGVGGRAKFSMDTNVVLGGWSNALKAIVTYGANGRTTGLGSAFVAELSLGAGTTAGNYAPLESELVMPSGASTGTATSFLHAAVSGAAAGTFDDNGFIMNLQGLTADTGHVFQASAVSGVDSTHALRIKIGSTAYFIPLHTSASFA